MSLDPCAKAPPGKGDGFTPAPQSQGGLARLWALWQGPVPPGS